LIFVRGFSVFFGAEIIYGLKYYSYLSPFIGINGERNKKPKGEGKQYEK